MAEKLTRQQIYDRIKASSKESHILDEMQRLGFWESSAVPTLSETLIRQEASLTQELNTLLEQDRKFSNQEAMLKEMRKVRMKAAKEKREETRQRNKQKRSAKAAAWKRLQEQQIIYLGEGVSAGLQYTMSDVNLLTKFGLPFFQSVTELAQKMQVDLPALRYLLYQRKVSKINHYHTFSLPKKSGGKRSISAPKKRLKQLQLWLLNTVLQSVTMGDQAHGFIKERSIVTNATPHLNQDIVINIDLKDFFPTISYARVKGLFQKLGYSEQLATIFALISTQAETEEVEMDGVRYYVQKGSRFLPQGSPASPAISNLIAHRLDKKVQGLAAKLNFTYTRYADDLSFSTNKENEKNIRSLLYFVEKIITEEGFAMHPDKTHIMRKGAQQKVTGIVVNEQLNVPREKLHKFRALLHNISVNGWQNQRWGKAVHPINAIEGFINFVSMVNKTKGNKFKADLQKIINLHGYPIAENTMITPNTQQPVPDVLAPEIMPEAASEQQAEKQKPTDWWNIF